MLIRKAKRKYFFLKFEQSKNNMKQTWNTINNILGRGKNSPHIISLKMIMVMYLLTLKTYQINSMIFFVNVGPKLASNIQSTGKSYLNTLRIQ